jgi:hypothetical protein
MQQNQPQDLIPPGWIGGFAESKPEFAYPSPNLSSLCMKGNIDNINLLTRQWPVEWPSSVGRPKRAKPDPKRCFQKFAPYISRAVTMIRAGSIPSSVPDKASAT